ncbi:MAG: cytochrome c biogenesis protein CcsA [Bacteroidales bacterium]|jgi:ABC-type transport system involved in cytochrome c biogenesis permease subunit|nr:cytochrome c biogenesis protein CcsA [Bacteroidales bacterium]
MKKQYIKWTAFGFLAAMLIILAAATFVEKAKGTSFAATHIYGSWWFVLLWFVIAGSSLMFVLQQKMYKKPMVFLLHASFLVILLGAFLTFTTSKQGKIHLRKGKSEHIFLDKKDNSQQKLPFEVLLSDFEIDYYPGTQSPSDYVSTIKILQNGKEIQGQVSMNKVFSTNGYRFYQYTYDRDLQGSALLVKSDKYGLPVTYFGYILLLIAMIGYFFSSKTAFRKLLNNPLLKRSTIAVLFIFGTITTAVAGVKTVPKETAKQLGEMQMLYRDRICPLQTFAKDFTLKLYGKSSYRSLSAEQVMVGWLFYPSVWKDEPVIKVKNKAVRQLLGIKGKYASFSDFFVDGKNYKLASCLQRIRMGEQIEGAKDIIAADEKIQLLFMLQTETLLKVFPQKGQGSELLWYSPADILPETMPENEQLLIMGSFSLLKEYAQKQDWKALEEVVGKLHTFQQKSAGGMLLSARKVSAEQIYNVFDVVKPVAFANICIGLLALVCFFRRENRSEALSKKGKMLSSLFPVFLTVNGVLILFLICLRGYISGRIPLGVGFETLQFLAVCILLLGFLFRKKMFLAVPFGFLFSGLVLLVSMMGASNPQITHLQPVLISPLLSIHVSLIMISYTLLGFITFISAGSFLSVLVSKTKDKMWLDKRLEQTSVFSRILLYPAVFLLAGGIFVGAVWAEVSWGTYWSWDPKETWALITLLIYIIPLHEKSIVCFQRPFFFHGYTFIAFLSVLMTYFGVNYILGGMHSYGSDIGLNIFLIIILMMLFFVVFPLSAWLKYSKK